MQAECLRTPSASFHSISVTSLHSTSVDTHVSSVIHVNASPCDDDSDVEFDADKFEDPNPCEWPCDMPESVAHLSKETLTLMQSKLNAWLSDAFQPRQS